jgi:hypothetical protein
MPGIFLIHRSMPCAAHRPISRRARRPMTKIDVAVIEAAVARKPAPQGGANQ